METNRKIVTVLGAIVAIAAILRLALGPATVMGAADIYAVANVPHMTQVAVRDADKPAFPD
jgi:hypothetical protein